MTNRQDGAGARRRAPVRLGRAAASLGMLASLGAGLAACEKPEGRFMSIGTAGTGGIYYVLGGAIANQMNQRDPQRQFTAEVTGGSVENVNRIREGQLDIAMVLAVSAYEAYRGEGDYAENPVKDLRILAPLYPNTTHLLVRPDAPIQSVADLRGKRVSVGASGSGTEQVSRHLLEAAGLGYEDVDAKYLSFSESSAALQDGAIDAAIISVGYPASAVLEATTVGAGRLVPIDGEVADRLLQKYPYYDRAEIPAGVYRGVTQTVPTVSMMNWVVARESLPADVVEDVLEVFSTGRGELIKVHDMANQIDLADLEHAPIPVHPAAEAWLAEHGTAPPAVVRPAGASEP